MTYHVTTALVDSSDAIDLLAMLIYVFLRQWGSVTHKMAVPVPSISCCVLNHQNLFYHIQNRAFNRDTCCHLVLRLRLLPFHYASENKLECLSIKFYLKPSRTYPTLEWSNWKVLLHRRFRPHPQTLDYAGKAWQAQTLYLITSL